jgi:hypothetical protein
MNGYEVLFTCKMCDAPPRKYNDWNKVPRHPDTEQWICPDCHSPDALQADILYMDGTKLDYYAETAR